MEAQDAGGGMPQGQSFWAVWCSRARIPWAFLARLTQQLPCKGLSGSAINMLCLDIWVMKCPVWHSLFFHPHCPWLHIPSKAPPAPGTHSPSHSQETLLHSRERDAKIHFAMADRGRILFSGHSAWIRTNKSVHSLSLHEPMTVRSIPGIKTNNVVYLHSPRRAPQSYLSRMP